MSDIPVIAFGPNPETYYIGMGMRYYAPNMPPSAQGTVKKWPAIQIKWMSIEADGAFVARDAYSSQVEYDTRVTADAISKFTVYPSAEFVTFGPNKGNYCVIMPGAAWSGYMEDEMIKQLREIEAKVGGLDIFTRGLNGILFGKGNTMIFMFKGAFAYSTDEEAEGGKLEELLDDYINRQPPWTIERGSSLCQWNVDYYFLKFKDTQSSTIMMHWSLPDGMSEQLAELKETLVTPESQQAIANYEQRALLQATNNFNLAVSTGNALRTLTGPYEYRW